MEYALCGSKKVVSKFKQYFEFIEWSEYDERDNIEIRSKHITQKIHIIYIYIEAYDKNYKLPSKSKDNMMIRVNYCLKKLTEFKLNY